ncbi:MAG: hypothetical protein B7Y25_04015 [Alphaproteobacteria bacterium 16-39-46]|nr:MAG: hypothetical protein B7Y25_04015 [Alphaproteobacteria bacterium 16-39-46]OZA43099.1 MAG: hypothetical protein B7X84_04150 [Alphaproteobacteria bacterium 17-39-52]HQS84334.1 hypothetical protein [Alphaproteobacteria bacterium]HQS93939.1 hypothetical protein [Alphaproteobacteria bacterium]
MKSRFLSLVIFFLTFSYPIVSHGMELREGLEEWIRSRCASHGISFNEKVLLSLTRSASKLIENNRFYGDLTSLFDPNFPPHPQGVSLLDLTCFPSKARSSLFHLLFPSPTGILVANQTGDPIGKLTPSKTGRLLRLTENYLKEHMDETTFKLTLYNLLLGLRAEPDLIPTRLEKYSSLLKEFPEFCHHDFKVTLLERTETILETINEEDLEKEHISLTDPLILTKVLKCILANTSAEQTFFTSGLLNEGDLEMYQAALSPSAPETELTKTLRRLKNKKSEFETVRFIEILGKALREQGQDQQPLPESLVERSIFFFFGQKVKTQDDILNFFSGYLGVDPEALRPTFPTTVFSEKMYWDTRNNPEALKAALLNPQRASLLSFGYNLFENPLPLLSHYKTATYQGKPFPNCIEAFFENFFNIVCHIKRAEFEFLKSHLARKKESEEVLEDTPSEAQAASQEGTGHIFTALHLLPPDHPLNSYYNWLNENPELRFSQENRDRIAELCSARPHVRYLKSTTGKGGEKDYELAPGFLNFLNLVRSHFAQTSEALPFEENLETLTQELRNLCTFLSRKNFKLTWQEEDLDYSLLKNDYFGTLTFLINDKKSFTLTMEMGAPGHGEIKRFPLMEGDWRQTVDIDALQKTLPPEILALFLTPETYEKTLPNLSPQDQLTLTHSLDLESVEMKCAIIKAAYTHNLHLKPLAKRLMHSISEFSDTSATDKLMKVLFPLMKGESPFLTDEEMSEIFTQYPDFLNYSLEDPDTPNTQCPGNPNNHLALFAIEHGKTSWLKAALPKISTLIFNSFLKEETFLEFLKTYLIQCSKLNYLYIYALNEKFTEGLCPVLPHLTGLPQVSFFLDQPYSTLSSLLISLPPSLEEFSLRFGGIDSWKTEDNKSVPILNKEAWQQLVPHLQTFFKENPRTTFNLGGNGMFSEEQQEEIRQILNVDAFPEDRFNLTF